MLVKGHNRLDGAKQMKTLEDYQYDYIERMAIMCENGKPEPEAHSEATYQVRQDMVTDGMDFSAANVKVMGIRKLTLPQDAVL